MCALGTFGEEYDCIFFFFFCLSVGGGVFVPFFRLFEPLLKSVVASKKKTSHIMTTALTTLTTTTLPQKQQQQRRRQKQTTTMLFVGPRVALMRSSSSSSSPFLMSLCDDDDDGMRRRLFCREKKGRANTVVGASSSSLASPKAAVAASKGVARRTRRRRLLKESSSSSSSSLRRRTTCERRVDAAATKVDDDDKNDDECGGGGVTAAARTTFLRPQSRKRFAPTAAALLLALTASALLFPETSLAKAKAAAVENSAAAGFSFKVILDWILHLDKHLVELFATSGRMAYGVLFAIIFAETGFVVTPFLPGDSLLFACGALGALGVLNFPLVFGLLFVAAVLGDTVNYTCGAFLGQVAIEKNPKIFKPEYIAKTRTFYDKYGGRTVVLARFFVIVRTFAPFIAGVAKMNYSKFALYNVLGAGVWISSFMGLGYFFGNVPVVKENFATTILVIIVLSLLPVIFEVVNHKKDSTASA